MDIPHASPILHDEDPAPVVDRKWGASSIFNVRTSDVHNPWVFYPAASLLLLCGGFLNFIVARAAGLVFASFLSNSSDVLPPWWNLYGWLFDLAIAGVFYFVLAAMVPRPAPQTA